MGLGSSRSVEIQICNKTQNITLKNPRTYFDCGSCSKRPRPMLSPGSSDTCIFWGDPKLWGLVGTTDVSGILVYEAESFTLAIYFYNPIDYNKFSMELGLEVSPGKAHLGRLFSTYSRMAGGTYSNSDQGIKFTHVTVTGSHRSTQLSHGPIKVMATMSRTTSSMIKVVLEEQEESMEAAERRIPQGVRRNSSRNLKIQFDIPVELMGKPGNAGELPENPAGITGTT